MAIALTAANRTELRHGASACTAECGPLIQPASSTAPLPGMVPHAASSTRGSEHHGVDDDQGVAGGPPQTLAERVNAQRTALLCAASGSVPFLLAMLIGRSGAIGARRVAELPSAPSARSACGRCTRPGGESANRPTSRRMPETSPIVRHVC
jgi:hypothetical protein